MRVFVCMCVNLRSSIRPSSPNKPVSGRVLRDGHSLRNWLIMTSLASLLGVLRSTEFEKLYPGRFNTLEMIPIVGVRSSTVIQKSYQMKQFNQ